MHKSKLLPLLVAHSLFFREQLEQFAPDALYKGATVSDSLRLLMTKEQQERFALFLKQIAFLLTKNKQSTRKTDERIPNPAVQ